MTGRRLRWLGAFFVGALVCLSLVMRAGAGDATGSRVPSGLRSPSIAPLPVPAGFPPAKAARFRAMDRLRQRAAATPATAPSQGSVAAGLTSGILGLHDGGPFSPSQFVGTNLWNGRVRGRWLVVQAGGVPVGAPGALPPGPASASRTQAGVFVYWRGVAPSSAAPSRVVGVIRAPDRPVGQLVVDSVRGGVLRLSLAGTGRVYRFSVATLRFL